MIRGVKDDACVGSSSEGRVVVPTYEVVQRAVDRCEEVMCII